MLVPLLAWMQMPAATVRAEAGGDPNAHSVRVCDVASPHFAACTAHVLADPLGHPQSGAAPLAGSYGSVQFHAAYNLPITAPNAQTIAIVDAFTDPNIESDLAVYDQQFGLPPCTQANGCLKVINSCATYVSRKQTTTTCGSTVDSGWALEASMDVEIAHAICQSCKILFVEAYSNSFGDLGAAENLAVQNGATEISNSWGAPEFSTETQYDSYWNHPGIATEFSTGDLGNQVEYPAASPYVVSVGGTTLNISAKNAYRSESAWSGGGSGCSLYESANSWQMALSNWSMTGCGTHRATADVSADANPTTGAAVYDSVPYGGTSGWYQVGGTSLAAPLVASVFALAGGVSGVQNAGSVPYNRFTSSNSRDVTTGTNGTCGTIMCTAGIGYDGPTGPGTPNGIGGF
jgi:subtilase family serine protease